MPYRIEITPHAVRQMKGLAKPVRQRINVALHELSVNPRPHSCLKLKAMENAWRIRVGEYRIIYEIHDNILVVIVIRIDHRSIVYRLSM